MDVETVEIAVLDKGGVEVVGAEDPPGGAGIESVDMGKMDIIEEDAVAGMVVT